MPPFRRRLFASVSVLSLILCLATVGFWVRSYWRNDFVSRVDQHVHARRIVSIWFDGGRAYVYWSAIDALRPEEGGYWVFLSETPHSFRIGPPSAVHPLPLWLPAILFAFAPAWWLLSLLGTRRTLHRRRKLGLCLGCGYDLRVQRAMSLSNGRASPERCPECGTAV